MEYPKHKISYLDGIRGVAAFFTFFHHFLLCFYPAYFSFKPEESNFTGKLWDIKYGQSIFSVLSNGQFCVYIFFVLSGLVLSSKYFQTEQLETLISGAQRRFVRLFVPVAFTLCIAYLMILAGLFYNVPVSHLKHSEWWIGSMWEMKEPLKELSRCLLYDTMFNGNNNFDTSMWTIAPEFSGSMFVFAFLALCHKTQRKGLLLALAFFYTFYTNQAILGAFVSGISLNYVINARLIKNKFIIQIIALLLLVLSLILGSFPSGGDVKNTIFEHLDETTISYGFWFHMVGAYCLVLAFVLSNKLQYIAELKPLKFLGRISFSFYLLHPLLLGSLSCYLYLKMNATFGPHASVAYTFVITSVIGFFLSWLMTKYIDNEGVAISKFIYNKWFKKIENDSH